MRACTILLAAALLPAGCATTRWVGEPCDRLRAQLQSGDPAARSAAADEAWRAGVCGIHVAGDLMASSDPAAARAAARALVAIGYHCTRPQATAAERRAASAEMVALLEREGPEALQPSARRSVLRVLSLFADDLRSIRAIAQRLREPETAEAALYALERIPHRGAGEELLRALDDPALALPRSTVLLALGARRSRDAVPALLAALEADPRGEDGRAARTALSRIGDPRAEAALRAAAADRADPQATADLLHFADARLAAGSRRPVRRIYEDLLRSAEPHVRAAAAVGLGRVGGREVLDPLAAALADPEADARAAAREALVALEGSAVTRALLASYDRAAGFHKADLLRVLAAREAPEAAALAAAAFAAEDAIVRLAALEVAGACLEPALEPLLIQTMQGGAPVERTAAEASLARRVELRLAAGQADRARITCEFLLAEAQDAAVANRALRAAGSLGCPELLPAIGLRAARPETREQAERARLVIACRSIERDRGAAVALLREICGGGASRGVRQQAASRLRALGEDVASAARSRGFLTDWWLSGPWPAATDADWDAHPFGPAGAQLPPPAPGAGAPPWREFCTDDVDGVVNLVPCFEPHDNVVAYACAVLERSQGGYAVLRVGSDDGVAIWLNGERVHSRRVFRGLAVDEDSVPVQLRAGRNLLLLKISQGGGDWGFCARLCNASGEPLDLSR